MTGLQGSGKSTVSKKLAGLLQATLLSVDPIESRIISSGIERSYETGYAAYLVAQQIAEVQLSISSVIIDASNYVEEAQKMWETLALEKGVELIVVECINSDEVLHKQRLKNRTRGLNGFEEIAWADVEKRKTEHHDWQVEKFTIDTKNDIDPQIDSLVKRLD